MKASTIIIVLVLLAIAAGVAWFLYQRQQKEKARIAAMSPEERELHEATKEYQLRVGQDEATLQSVTKDWGKKVRSAEKILQGAQSIGSRSLASFGSVRLSEDRIVTSDGTAFFSAGPVEATVDSAGNLAVTKRVTLTRLVAGGIIGGLIFQKKQKHDAREVYLLIETPSFGSLVECKPDDGAKVRQFAMKVNAASKSWSLLDQQRDQAVAVATEQLGDVQIGREHQIGQAAQNLDVTRKDTGRMDAAKTSSDKASVHSLAEVN